jgi:hypothetical protein
MSDEVHSFYRGRQFSKPEHITVKLSKAEYNTMLSLLDAEIDAEVKRIRQTSGMEVPEFHALLNTDSDMEFAKDMRIKL